MPRTLVVTNDFPPRQGGIQSFVEALVLRQPPGSTVVYASGHDGDRAYDRSIGVPVVRHPTGLLLPTPAAVRRASEVARAEGCDRLLFGAAAPLGLLAAPLRAAGVVRSVGLTHGHEAAWAQLPVARRVLRRIGDEVDVLTHLGSYTRTRIAAALSPAAAGRMRRLAPGVDDAFFRPDAGGDAVRRRLGLADRPVVVCVSRLVRRKGQDVLLSAWPLVRRAVPDAALLLVGDGPYRGELQRCAADRDLGGSVLMTGAVPHAELPAHYGAGDVFAMPCRTRRRGLDVEGLGMVYLEASACGLPVVAGDSGGAPDAVLEGETGRVVRGADPAAVAAALVELLADPELARRRGAAGRAWVAREWRWDLQAARLAELLAGPADPGRVSG